MKPITNTFGETVLAMEMCYGENGNAAYKCGGDQCPYYKYRDCTYRLRRDAIYYLKAALNKEVNEMDLKAMEREYMEDKRNAENHVL